MELIPPFGPLSRRGLNPIKPVYDPDRPDGRLSLTASAFNKLRQYTAVLVAGASAMQNSPFSSLAVFGCNRRQYSLRLPTEGWFLQQQLLEYSSHKAEIDTRCVKALKGIICLYYVT